MAGIDPLKFEIENFIIEFENVYLTLEEQEEFAKRAIPWTARKREFYPTGSVPGKEYDVLLHFLFIDIPFGFTSKRGLIIETLKEAFKIYGIDGDPKLKEEPVIEFDSNEKFKCLIEKYSNKTK